MKRVTPVLLVHGGAGNPARDAIDEDAHHAALRSALDAGWQRLADGAGALDAAEAAVWALEDCELFNAGRGSVPTTGGQVEMDAAVMDGAGGGAGACAGVTRVRHPVSLARSIMEATPHVLLVGTGAEAHAEAAGLERPPEEWFARRAETATIRSEEVAPGGRHGTVGAVALDAQGRLAAATSTGGVRGQLPGRVGDSPLIGAGTWADAHVAVSCTGSGEHFIRLAAAHELSARVRLGGRPLADAAGEVLAATGGGGGLIALASDGSTAMPFNTGLMFRGRVGADGARSWIWREEESE